VVVFIDVEIDSVFCPDIRVNLTPLSQMNSESFARKMTGGESLNDDQKKQIREQQEVGSLVFNLFS
jgi:hypothetical protein